MRQRGVSERTRETAIVEGGRDRERERQMVVREQGTQQKKTKRHTALTVKKTSSRKRERYREKKRENREREIRESESEHASEGARERERGRARERAREREREERASERASERERELKTGVGLQHKRAFMACDSQQALRGP